MAMKKRRPMRDQLAVPLAMVLDDAARAPMGPVPYLSEIIDHNLTNARIMLTMAPRTRAGESRAIVRAEARRSLDFARLLRATRRQMLQGAC